VVEPPQRRRRERLIALHATPMSHFDRRCLVLLAFALALLQSGPAACAAAARPPAPDDAAWVLCFENRDIPPWREVNGRGLNFQLLDAAARDAGLRVRYVARPWRRCQTDLAKDRIDGVFAMSHSVEREARWVYPPAAQRHEHRMFIDAYVLVRRRGDGVELRDGRVLGLRGPVAAQPGYSIVDDLKRMGLEVDDGTAEASVMLRKLVDGRVGAVALGETKLAAMRAEGDPNLADVEVLPGPLVRKDYFLVLSKARVRRDPEAVQRLWAGIRREREAMEARLAPPPR
jgi:polar amino acid transport system substrate-binding protein